MEDFNSFVNNAKTDGSGDIMSMVNSLASKFDGKSTNDLLSAIYKEAKTLDMDLLARLIYDSKGPITIRDEDAEYIKNEFIVKLPYYVQKEILPSL